MQTISNSELSAMQREKHDLIRTFDKKIITEEEFNQKFNELEKRINEKIRLLLDNVSNEIKKIETEENKMAEEKNIEKKCDVKEKKERKVKEDTYASVIAKVLAMKSIKNIEAATAKVLEIKPGRDEKHTVSQIKGIIKLVKDQKKRWANYTWDEATFQLTEKE